MERKKLRQAQAQQNVLYEYVISDSDTKVYDLYTEFTTSVTMGATYSNFLFFYVKGKKHLVFVENQERLMMLEVKKMKMTVMDIPPCGASGEKIQRIDRYSAYVMVQYERCVEFVQFDQLKALETVSKIRISEPIVNIQPDIVLQRYMFVQSPSQIYLYDCDPLLQRQHEQMALMAT